MEGGREGGGAGGVGAVAGFGGGEPAGGEEVAGGFAASDGDVGRGCDDHGKSQTERDHGLRRDPGVSAGGGGVGGAGCDSA